ncbi:MAG: biopolymer transporter ExbD [Candidatus Krumholzibacteria bacterium]|nr:biopolymer transporter ExbD [Candidatus Krumholzibacteria bacterium]
MSGTSSKQTNGGIHEVNMTPLIDVSLVLVVMLLLLTPLAFESSIAVRRAVESAKASEKKLQEERIELTVVSEDSVLVNRAMVSRRELSGVLRPMLDGRTDRRVVLACADQVEHGIFVDVLDRVKLSGAGEIAVLGR